MRRCNWCGAKATERALKKVRGEIICWECWWSNHALNPDNNK